MILEDHVDLDHPALFDEPCRLALMAGEADEILGGGDDQETLTLGSRQDVVDLLLGQVLVIAEGLGDDDLGAA